MKRNTADVRRFVFHFLCAISTHPPLQVRPGDQVWTERGQDGVHHGLRATKREVEVQRGARRGQRGREAHSSAQSPKVVGVTKGCSREEQGLRPRRLRDQAFTIAFMLARRWCGDGRRCCNGCRVSSSDRGHPAGRCSWPRTWTSSALDEHASRGDVRSWAAWADPDTSVDRRTSKFSLVDITNLL